MRHIYITAGHRGAHTGASGIIDEGAETIRLRNAIADELRRRRVTARTDSDGMTGQLVLVHQGGRYDGTTELLDMTPGADGVYRVNKGIVFTIGETVDLSVRWKSAAGTVTNESLGTVPCTEEAFRPLFAWGGSSDSLAYGYRTRKESGAAVQSCRTRTVCPHGISSD